MKQLIFILALLFSLQAHAGLISIDVTNNNVSQGQSITVNLQAKNFAAFDSFDFDFQFNNSLFAFDATTFSSDLTTLNPLQFVATENRNGVSIAFVDFFPVSTTDFLLASFDLTAVAVGNSNFSLGNATFSLLDTFTLNTSILAIDTSAVASATVLNKVTEPSTWLMLLLALAILTVLPRKTTITNK